MAVPRRRRFKKFILILGGVLLLLLLGFTLVVDRFVEPLLKDRIHTLIVQGSDSLYKYSLGRLHANFFGGNVEVESLHIEVDSTRYEQLQAAHALPSLTMRLDLARGHIKGLGIIALLFRRQIRIHEIFSGDANIKLTRHIKPRGHQAEDNHLPLWKAMQPTLKMIRIDQIRLEGIKMNYKNADSSEVKIEFEGCTALFKDIQIDSTSAVDTARIGFTKDISLRLDELKYRSPDSAYKLKAQHLYYSSTARSIVIDSFKFQPTLEPEDFYNNKTYQESMYDIRFAKASFSNVRLDQFIRRNIVKCDSVVVESPVFTIVNDRYLLPTFNSKIGKYPQQQLLKANVDIRVKEVLMKDGMISYTESNPDTRQEGKLEFSRFNAQITNVTNNKFLIDRNGSCLAKVQCSMFGSVPLQAAIDMRLDSTNGYFSMNGKLGAVNAAQINTVAVPLGNVQFNGAAIDDLEFTVRGDDYSASSDVRMLYHNMNLTIRKTDEQTGETNTRKFISKLVNKFVIYPDNPSPATGERTARGSKVSRLTTTAFFGLIWKAVFAGMQDVMMKSGRYY